MPQSRESSRNSKPAEPRADDDDSAHRSFPMMA
jgi:hypothetical protein